MRPLRRLIVSIFVVSAVAAALPTASASNADPLECCKVCRKGKACGDSCIARKKTCTKPPGCACDG